MANLAYRNSGGRRRGSSVGAPRRPALLCEIGRRGPHLCLRECRRHPGHDVVVASSALELMHLLEEVIFLQTPDDRSGWMGGHAVRAVACVAKQKLGGKDGLGLSGISKRGNGQRHGDMSGWVQGEL